MHQLISQFVAKYSVISESLSLWNRPSVSGMWGCGLDRAGSSNFMEVCMFSAYSLVTFHDDRVISLNCLTFKSSDY